MQHPDCERDPSECRITYGSALMGEPIEWTPVYDGNGTLVNSDPNVMVRTASCSVCGQTWTITTDEDGSTVGARTPAPS